MKKIYISIPIQGHNTEVQRMTADMVASMLSKQGWKPVNPFKIYAGQAPDYWDHITADLRALADCDAVFFCSGWEQSLGCRIEHDFVERIGQFTDKVYKIIYEY